MRRIRRTPDTLRFAMNRTVERTIDILDLVSQTEQGMTLAEIVQRTKMPKTSAYDILRSLEKKYMIYRRDDSVPSYSIGFRAFAIGNTYSRSSHLLTNSADCVKALAETLGKTVLLCKDYDNKALIVGKHEPRGVLLLTPEIGAFADMGDCAAGKIFAAFSGAKVGSFNRRERETILSLGYAVHSQGSESPVYSIAAPVFNFENMLSGIVMVMALNHGTPDIASEAAQVVACVREISRRIGYHDGGKAPAAKFTDAV